VTRRSRSILIDSTLGKIFTNTNSTVVTDPSKLIAGTKIRSSTVSASSKTTTAITNNMGTGVGIAFPTGGLITSVTLSVSSAATGRSIVVAIRVGSSYASSTVSTSVSLSTSTLKATSTVSVAVQEGQYVFLDITQVGSIKAGSGLSVRLDYYTG
jgi:hypothetical protein